MSKLKVLVANDVYLPLKDGVVNCMRNYLINYPSDEVEACAFFPSCPKDYVIRDEEYEKITYNSFKIPFSSGAQFGLSRAIEKSIRKNLYNRQFDIIHVHDPFGIAKCLLDYAHEKNIPIVSTYHTNYIYIFKKIFKLGIIWKPYIKKLGKRYSQMDEVFAGTEATYKQLMQYDFNGKCSILPFGTFFKKDENREYYNKRGKEIFAIDDDKKVFCFVGRIVESKRVQESLKALKILKDKGRKFVFLVAGEGNYLNSLKAFAKKLELEEDVLFLNKVSDEDLKCVYASSDMLLFPSILDNFALVKVEAASFRTPGLYIEGSNTAYGTTDNVDAFHCKDSPEAIAEKADYVFTNPSLVQQVGENALENLVITWKEATEILVKNYRRIIDEHGKEKN